jgi:hypothetical protein
VDERKRYERRRLDQIEFESDSQPTPRFCCHTHTSHTKSAHHTVMSKSVNLLLMQFALAGGHRTLPRIRGVVEQVWLLSSPAGASTVHVTAPARRGSTRCDFTHPVTRRDTELSARRKHQLTKRRLWS